MGYVYISWVWIFQARACARGLSGTWMTAWMPPIKHHKPHVNKQQQDTTHRQTYDNHNKATGCTQSNIINHTWTNSNKTPHTNKHTTITTKQLDAPNQPHASPPLRLRLRLASAGEASAAQQNSGCREGKPAFWSACWLLAFWLAGHLSGTSVVLPPPQGEPLV